MSLSVALWATFAALQVADIASTYIALQRVTGAYEANPLLNKLFSKVGVLPALLGVKALMGVAIYALSPPTIVAPVLVAAYAYVVGNNVKIILEAK